MPLKFSLKYLVFCVNLLSWLYGITVYQVKNKKGTAGLAPQSQVILESQIKLEQLNVYSDIEWKWEKPFY